MFDTYNNIEEWANYTNQVFYFLNGWINPINKAHLVFGPPVADVPDLKTRNILGQTLINEVRIDLLKIGEFVKSTLKEYTNEKIINSWILYTVLHELSHCDQDFPYGGNKYMSMRNIEYVNDRNAYDFYKAKKQAIYQYCSPFYPEVIETIFEESIKDAPFYLSYTHIKSLNDKTMRILEFMTGMEHFENIEFFNSHRTIIIEWGVDKVQRGIYIRKDGVWGREDVVFEILKFLTLQNSRISLHGDSDTVYIRVLHDKHVFYPIIYTKKNPEGNYNPSGYNSTD